MSGYSPQGGGRLDGAKPLSGGIEDAPAERLAIARCVDVKATDAATLASVFGIVLLVTFVACALPGRRAAATSPLESLRDERRRPGG
jgi:hypothetical protein